MSNREKIFQILLVEDNPVDILMTEEALQGWKIKYQLRVVKDGEAAMNFLLGRGDHNSARVPDLVILDLNLPKRNGKEILSEIQSNSRFSETIVVVITTSSTLSDFNDCKSSGATRFIPKPDNIGDYILAIRSIQELWLTQSQIYQGNYR
jgi:two-component system, chemotaxis family, response regulator Rcp1